MKKSNANKIPLYKVRLTRTGYDENGKYWGVGKPLYCAELPSGQNAYVRADSRADAAELLAPAVARDASR